MSHLSVSQASGFSPQDPLPRAASAAVSPQSETGTTASLPQDAHQKLSRHRGALPAAELKLSEAPAEAWGKRSQIAGTVRALQDLQGNQDGLWNNEDQPAGQGGDNAVGRNPLVLKGRAQAWAGWSTQDEIATLRQFRSAQEATWQAPVTQLDLSTLKSGELFAVQKAIALTEMQRHPSEVTEGFLAAAGQVNGESIAPRDLFWQRFQPVGEPSGKMVVMFPGFLQTGRNFYEQVTLLNQAGHDVLVMDQQWAGQTRGGEDGGVDRGYGIARDVAAMTAYAQQQLEADYATNPDRELILMGTSLGGGPGVMGALTLQANGMMHLEGPEMPAQVKVVLQGPFFEATDSFMNDVFDGASQIPLLNAVPLPATGLPVLTYDATAGQKIAQGAVLEDLQARLQAMTAVNEDMQVIMDLIAAGKGPQVPVEIIHSQGDPLASAERVQALQAQLPQAHLTLLSGADHVLEQQKTTQQAAIDALQRLIQP